MPHLPAARLGDPISDLAAPMVPGPPTGVLGMPGTPPLAGVPTVLIGGKPAAVVGTAGVCTPHYELLATNVIRPATPPRVGGQVLIGGFPAARQFDQLVCNARIVAGAPNVLIGG